MDMHRRWSRSGPCPATSTSRGWCKARQRTPRHSCTSLYRSRDRRHDLFVQIQCCQPGPGVRLLLVALYVGERFGCACNPDALVEGQQHGEEFAILESSEARDLEIPASRQLSLKLTGLLNERPDLLGYSLDGGGIAWGCHQISGNAMVSMQNQVERHDLCSCPGHTVGHARVLAQAPGIAQRLILAHCQ